MQLKPVVLLPARERIASVLRDAIMDGKFQEGEALTLEQIATQLGVSKMPVREAFQILERDGLITLKANKGAVVRGVTANTLWEHYQVRAALECEVVRLICENGADLRELQEMNRDFAEAIEQDRPRDQSGYNINFHTKLWDLCGNSYLKALLQQVTVGVCLAKRDYLLASDQGVLDHHRQIVDACINHDAENAMKIMREHLYDSCTKRVNEFYANGRS